MLWSLRRGSKASLFSYVDVEGGILINQIHSGWGRLVGEWLCGCARLSSGARIRGGRLKLRLEDLRNGEMGDGTWWMVDGGLGERENNREVERDSGEVMVLCATAYSARQGHLGSRAAIISLKTAAQTRSYHIPQFGQFSYYRRIIIVS